MIMHYEIPATPDMMVLGYLDAAVPPVMRIGSGDTVTLHSHPAGGRMLLPPDDRLVPADYRTAIEALPPGPAPHFLTGPIYVEGAQPGDTLAIEILNVELRMDWGFVAFVPLLGTLPKQFDRVEIIHPLIDRTRRVAMLPWGKELSLDPFFGIMAVAPPPHWGDCTSAVPRAFGGNMDNKELKAGVTLYLPIFNEGALFSAGDGHGVQGDGEVCVTALETGLSGTFRLTVRKDLHIERPFAENATHLIAIGLSEDLDAAAAEATREMVANVVARSILTPAQAYMLCSLSGDLRITQLVNGVKGVHMLLAKQHME